MKRILAVALVAGALLLGGCGRPHTTTPPPGPPAAAVPAAAARSAASAAPGPSSSSAADVDSLLGAVDKQLSSDDQTPADQD